MRSSSTEPPHRLIPVAHVSRPAFQPPYGAETGGDVRGGARINVIVAVSGG
jgi:hypothetical protein